MLRAIFPVWAVGLLVVPACSPFHVAYRLDSRPTGVDVYSAEGEHLGRTPVVVTERGVSRTMIGQASDCVEGGRSFEFRPRCLERARIAFSITIPRTCRGYDSPAVAAAKPDHDFVADLPAGSATPCPPPAPPSPPPGPVAPVQSVAQSSWPSPWLPVAPDSLPQPVPLPINKWKSRPFIIAGVAAFTAAWAIPSLFEAWAAADPNVAGSGGAAGDPDLRAGPGRLRADGPSLLQRVEWARGGVPARQY